MNVITEYIEAMVDLKVAVQLGNYDHIPGLIERTQVLANRMEAAIDNVGTIGEIERKRIEAKDELRRLEREINQAEQKLAKLKENLPTKAEKKAMKQEAKEHE